MVISNQKMFLLLAGIGYCSLISLVSNQFVFPLITQLISITFLIHREGELATSHLSVSKEQVRSTQTHLAVANQTGRAN